MKRKISILLAAVMAMSFMVACSPKKDESGGKEADINEIHKAVKEELGEDYIPSMALNAEELENLTDVDSDEVEEFIAEIPMMSTHVDTFIAVKAKSEEADEVEEDLEEYREYLNEEALNYPMNLAKVKAAKVVRHGDYVFFLMLGGFDMESDPDSSEALEFAEAEVAKVEAVIDGFFK